MSSRLVRLVLGLLALAACGDSAFGAPRPPARTTTPAVTPTSALARAPLFTSSTRALVVGVLEFQDPSLADFSSVLRRDAEVARTLVERGVPAANVVTLLDAQATRAAVLDALAAAADATPQGGTLIFYYAGHGTRTQDGDIAYVAVDTYGSTAHTTGLSLASLEATLAPRIAGKRVLFFADCCHSGGLGELARRLDTRGATAASLTSADASNLSTGNWTYSQLLIEGLRGEACLDANDDGTIAITELESAVRSAMRYRERQRSGAFITALDPTLEIARRSGAPRSGSRAGTFLRTREGAVVRVQRDDGTRATVRAFLYATTHDTEVPLDELAPITDTRYTVGTHLSVAWGGRVWPAVVTQTDGDFAYITYPGWPSYWDEWILSDRVRAVTSTP